MTTLSWIRGVNGTLGRLAPEHVAGKMRRAFMTPRNLPPRDWELPVLASAERITLRFGLSALRWGQGPTVLLMHGWEGRPTQFAALIETLVQAGHTVVSLEGPGHGRSPGEQANVVLFARALLEAAAELPPLRAVIGHSMGGASVLLALQMGLRTEAAVSIAAAGAVAPVCCVVLPIAWGCQHGHGQRSFARSSAMWACRLRGWMSRGTSWSCRGWWCMLPMMLSCPQMRHMSSTSPGSTAG